MHITVVGTAYVGLVAGARLAEVPGADALAIATGWSECRHPDSGRTRDSLARPGVVGGRNQYDSARTAGLGFTHDSIGRAHACAS